ncbi:hypothetical protein [Lewinella sp. LCG006]|uniref:hypothetical protein n=1 Tax=Lewinella sp. LCG006 TaxID=3231911 RepID=UPI00345FB203
MQDKQQSWLERLSMESWQAEMVISGVAIFGSFQLFDGVSSLIDWLYFRLPGSFMYVAYFLCFYLFIAVAMLSMSFLGHFVVRSIWIASIGLESVYPEIRRENATYSPHFMDQFLRRFPSFKGFNEELDRIGSSILAYALMLVMVFIGIGCLIGLALLLGTMTAMFTTEELGLNVSLGLLGIAVVVIFFNAILNSKALQNRPWVQKIHFPLTIGISYLFANVFFRPHSYLSFIIRTNLDPKRYWKFMIMIVIGVTIISGSVFQRTNLVALLDDVYLRFDQRTDRLYSGNYLDESAGQELAFIRPQIPSMVIHSAAELTLFLPLPEREERKIFLRCSEKEPADMEDRDEARNATYAYRLSCYKEQIKVAIDDQAVEYVVKVYIHPHDAEPGLQYFFPNLDLLPGEHQIIIQHLAIEGAQEKTDRIPFIYLPK